MANQGKYTLSGGWIYVRGTEDQEDAPCIEAAQSAAVLEWARNEAEEACEPSGDPVRYYGEEDFEDTVSDLVKEITDGHMDEIEHLLDVEFSYLKTPRPAAPGTLKTSTMSKPKDKNEAIAYEAIMRAINELIPTTEYMQAENACTFADAKERQEYGESSGLLPDLRQVKDNMMADARSLAESIARLQREVTYAINGRPVPTDESIARMFADLGFPSIIKKTI